MQNETTDMKNTYNTTSNSKDYSSDLTTKATDYKEGSFTKAIETQTAKIPSGVYLGLAIGSMAASLTLAMFQEKKGWANFVGQWAPAFLIMGLYNKLVKVEGSDRTENVH